MWMWEWRALWPLFVKYEIHLMTAGELLAEKRAWIAAGCPMP